MSTPPPSKWLFFGPLGVVALLSLLVAGEGYLELHLDNFEIPQLGSLLFTVVFAAAVIERAVEVYVTSVFVPTRVWLGRELAIARNRVDVAEDAVTREAQRQATPGVTLDDGALQARRDKVSAEQDHLREIAGRVHDPLIQHQQKTAAWAAALAVALGFAAAAVGVRILGQFLHVDGSSLGDAFQQCQDRPEQPPEGSGAMADTTPTSPCIGALCKELASQFFWFRAVDVLLTTLTLAGGADGIHQIIKRTATSTARS